MVRRARRSRGTTQRARAAYACRARPPARFRQRNEAAELVRPAAARPAPAAAPPHDRAAAAPARGLSACPLIAVPLVSSVNQTRSLPAAVRRRSSLRSRAFVRRAVRRQVSVLGRSTALVAVLGTRGRAQGVLRRGRAASPRGASRRWGRRHAAGARTGGLGSR